MEKVSSPYHHPLNYLNTLFYGACPDAFTSSGLANFFVTSTPVQISLFREISSLIFEPEIRVKEICAGTRLDRWRTISNQPTDRDWQITLSDFSSSSLPAKPSLLNNDHFSFRTEIDDLFCPLPVLPFQKRYQAVLTTYGFDSVWFPQDRYYLKTPWGWYRRVFTFPSHLPPKFPKPESLPQSLSRVKLSLEDLKHFSPVEKFEPVNMETEEYGREISDYYRLYPLLGTNFPGGLLAKIKEFFATQLTPNGVFISGDVVFDGAGPPFDMWHERSGRIATYQRLNYSLAAHLLRRQGFRVNLYSLSDFLEKWHLSVPLFLTNHCILEVFRS